jgi:hypothetical protein
MASLSSRRTNNKVNASSTGRKSIVDNDTSEEELSVSSSARLDAAGDKNTSNHRAKQQSNGSNEKKKKKITTDEEIAKRYSNALEDEEKQQNKRARRVVTPLSTTQLMTGLVKIVHDFPTRYNLGSQHQKGKEPAYAAMLIQAYKNICHELAPNVSFIDAIAKIESLGGKKDVKLCLQQMRDQQRDAVLDKIIGQAARERILQDKRGSSNDGDDEAYVDSNMKNPEEEGEEIEADLADVVDASQRANYQPLDVDEAEKTENFDVNHMARENSFASKAYSHPDEEEENEANFDELEIASTNVDNPVLTDVEDGIEKASDCNENSHHSNLEEIEVYAVEKVISSKQVDSQPFSNDEENNAAFEQVKSFTNNGKEVGEQIICSSTSEPSSERRSCEDSTSAAAENRTENNAGIEQFETLENDNSEPMKNKHSQSITGVENEVFSNRNSNYTDRGVNRPEEGSFEDRSSSQDNSRDVILEDSEALVLDGTQEDMTYDVRANNSFETILNLAQTQTNEASQPETIFFSSEEVPTQLASQVENTQNNYYCTQQVMAYDSAWQKELSQNNTAESPEESSTQLVNSQEERANPELNGQQSMESPTQIVNSQFFATQNY